MSSSQRLTAIECCCLSVKPPAGHPAAPGYAGVKAGPTSARATSSAQPIKRCVSSDVVRAADQSQVSCDVALKRM